MEPHTGLNTLDYIVLGTLLLSGILALFRGFVREMFSLGTWAAAYFVAAKYHALLEPFVHTYIRSKEAVGLASGAAAFCGTLIVLTIIGSLIAKLIIRGHALTAIDRSLGFIFGALRGALVICLVYMAIVSIMWPDIDKPPEEQDKDRSSPPAWLIEAKTRPAMRYGAFALKAFLPETEKELEDNKKSAQDYIEQEYSKQKNETEKAIQQQQLDMMSTPTAAGNKENTVPAYDDKSRSNLDKLIDQKGTP